MDPVFAVAVGISILCIGHLWVKRQATVGKKVLWTAILCVPAIGPLFYGAIFESLDESDAPADESDTDAEEHTSDRDDPS